ncbi:hypothetical protein PSACC_03005 [Paramicrosporidium saccamoebae]|uniref:mRNA stability protein n=1 Tax=Paramicrosporidium saccamoebae TaxID=1246581 RepID=A0A2H9THK6_9FUNG|nr:hypothetical protein PSACC_03005 [Paramicrosporidium saccamoebae]
MSDDQPTQSTTPPGQSTATLDAATHHRTRLQERKYFDSGDYAMCKAGQTHTHGQLHPTPSAIPHSNSAGSIGKSPMKEPILEDSEEGKGSGFAQ